MASATGDGARQRRLLVLEPYFGGSHRAVLEALLPALERDGWSADVLSLPARKWKWRMRGAAITMADQVRELHASWLADQGADAGSPWDLIFASTFVNLAEFLSLAGRAVTGVPSVVYFHENQLQYPNRHSAEWDLQFPLTNITSALVADACIFNTRWNLDGFVTGIPPFLRQFPDHHPARVAECIAAKSVVLHPPFDPAPFDGAPVTRGARCRIVWPHRWEHDKDPEAFFAAVGRLAAEGHDFEVAVAGRAYAETRDGFERAGAALGGRLVHLGEPESREDYAALLSSADIAVSTARNEFFGLAMVEAAYCGCLPLVPDSLAYPEIYPETMRYAGGDQLVSRLRSAIMERPAPGQGRATAERFTVARLASGYAAEFERLAARKGQ
jgi:glycosyltransferase involved in cell wall biosynthesis